jgi:hypothetical protein
LNQPGNPHNGAEMGVVEPSPMDPDEKVAQTSKCKGATTIPIFLKSKR